MSYVGYLIAGWSLTFVTFIVYTYFVLRKGRILSSKVPEARRRWIDSENTQPK